MDLSVNRILKPYELRNLYNLSLQGKVSKDGMHATIKANLLKFAETEKIEALSTINNLLIGNPGTTFEYWNENYSGYRDANKVINWLDPPELNKNDTRFYLTSFVDDKAQETSEYKYYQRHIEANGFTIIKADNYSVKVYTPELALLFHSEEVPAKNMDTQSETTITTWEYFQTYIEAYKQGEQFFENEFKVSPNTLYGENAKYYVKDLHLNYFHVTHSGPNKGWGYVKKSYPTILTHKTIKDFGYYSGIVNKVEEQVKKYPQLFDKFDNKPDIEKQQPQEPETLPHDFSLNRARAICILLLQHNDKKNFIKENGVWDKKGIYAFIARTWPSNKLGEPQSQQTIYSQISTPLTSFKKKYHREYEYAEKLFDTF